MIISASRRTDIPAFYGKWLLNRIRAGYCLVRNPFNPKFTYRVSLRPEDVDAIVFWTRYPVPFLRHLDELEQRGYHFYFLFTVTDYSRGLELHLPTLAARIAAFKRLSARLGPARVVWRYDPILLSRRFSFDFHRRLFEMLTTELAGFTDTVIVSLVDYYRKTLRNLSPIRDELILHPEEHPDFPQFMRDLAQMAACANMRIQSCAEEVDLRPYGIPPGRCIDNERIRRLFGIEVPGRKDPHQRPQCGCVVSRDIGAYNTCPYGCLYCYATADVETALHKLRSHNPDAEWLG